VSVQDNEELLDLLNRSRLYLMQQEDLFGDVAFTGVKAPAGKDSARGELKDGGPARAAATGAGPQGFAYPDEPWVKTTTLPELNAMICNCLKCGLGPTRTKFVFGVGNPAADVMFIGEGPGADEDMQGEPFVGRAGVLLNKIIEATGMKREQVYICNIVKCRPPNNRAPLPAEEEMCTPYLMKQIEIVKPKFIICLGRTAAQWLLQTTEGLSALRGRMHDFRGAKLIVTYHPAALLRNPEWKKPTWEDMKMFMAAYETTRG
jgi:DNA polymerase